MPDQKISLCMIVKNEEENLPRCLDSVQGLVDEIVIADTGSTDRTVEVAEHYGARILTYQWIDDFADARNFVLDHATGDWILHLDADEEISPESRAILRETVNGCAFQGIILRVRNFNPPGSMVEYLDSYQTRLFQSAPQHRYHQAIHEQIGRSILQSGGTLERKPLMILHHGYKQRLVQGGSDRDERNTRMLEQAFAAEPKSAYLCERLASTYFVQGNHERAYALYRQLFLDLDYRQLQVENLFTTLSCLSRLAVEQADFTLATLCADTYHSISSNYPEHHQTSLAVVATVGLEEGKWYTKKTREQHLQFDSSVSEEALKEQMEFINKSREALLRARDAIDALVADETLLPDMLDYFVSMRGAVEILLAPAERALKISGNGPQDAKHGELLQSLLDADEIEVAIEEHIHEVDQPFILYIRKEVEKARTQQEEELAEGLEALADYLSGKLSQ